MARLSLSLLGPFEVVLGGAPINLSASKARALLAYLVVESGKPHSRDALAGLLWPDYPQRSARTNLRNTLSDLRAAIGDRDAEHPFLVATRETIQFNLESDHVLDVSTFQEVAEAGTVARLEEAVTLYQGPFLEDLSVDDSTSFDDWARSVRETLERLVLDALARLAGQYEDRGETARAIEATHHLVDLAPWHEEGHRTLMRLLALHGQRSAALAQYEACRRALRQTLDVAPSAETTQLYERIRTGEIGERVEDAAPQPVLHNLPVQLTPFVGREPLLAEIGERLSDPGCRLLTLVGPGGIGKTRLALEAARREVGRHEDGVYWVALAPLRAVDTLVSALVQSIGFSLAGGGDPWQRLLAHLRDKRMLLILDNFEHLLDQHLLDQRLLDTAPPGGKGAVDLVSELLETAPGVQVVVTSRVRLNVQSEHLLPVSGMAYPVRPDDPAARDVLRSDRSGRDATQYSAVRLFLASARRVRPGFEPGAGELADVVQICRLVQGMPLAILLAAAWMEMLSPAEIVAELERDYGLLEADLRDLPARQQSVEAVFDASWRLLDERERETFARLSVFRGGFTREAAQEVAGASLQTLRALVHNSFLQRNAGGRYEVHELLRQYAEHKLAEDPKREQRTADLHCRYFAEQLRRTIGEWAMEETSVLLLAEWDNLRAGWQWAISQARYVEVGAYTLLIHSEVDVGRFHERTTFLEQAARILRTCSSSESEREREIALGMVLVCQARHYEMIGYAKQSESALREGVSILRRLGAQQELASLALSAAWTMASSCETEAARILQDSIVTCREQDNLKTVAVFLGALGELALRRGVCDEAEGYCREAIRLGEQTENTFALGYASFTLAKVAYHRGDYKSAMQFYQDLAAAVKRTGAGGYLALYNSYLGDAALAMGDVETAQEFHQRAQASWQEAEIPWVEAASGEHFGQAYSLDRLGDISLAERDVGRARDLYRQALIIARDYPQVTLHLDVVVSQATLRAHEGRKEQAVELAGLVLHHPRSHFEVTKRAQRLLEELEAKLSPGVFRAAQTRGQARDLEATIEELLAELESEPETRS
jgi:DNA-binding SARP family transcriptional activator/predicted ATPase